MSVPPLISFDKRPGTLNFIVAKNQVTLMAPKGNLPPELAKFRTLLTTFHNIRTPIQIPIHDVLSQFDYLHEQRQTRLALRAQVLEGLAPILDEVLADGMTKTDIMAHVEMQIDELMENTDNRRLARTKSTVRSQPHPHQADVAQERSSEDEWNENFEIEYDEYLINVERETALQRERGACESALRWMDSIRPKKELTNGEKEICLPEPSRTVALALSSHQTPISKQIEQPSYEELGNAIREEPSIQLPPPYKEVIDVDEAESFYSAMEERPLSRDKETEKPNEKTQNQNAQVMDVALREVSGSPELSTNSARPPWLQREAPTAIQEADTESSGENTPPVSSKPTPSPGRRARRLIIESDESDDAHSDYAHTSEAAVGTPDCNEEHVEASSDDNSLEILPPVLRARARRRVIETDSSSDDDDLNFSNAVPLLPSIDYPVSASPGGKLLYIFKKRPPIDALPKQNLTRARRMARNLRKWHFASTHLALFPEDTPNKPFVRPKNKSVTMNLYSPHRPLRPSRVHLNGPKPPNFKLAREIKLSTKSAAGATTGNSSRPVFTTPDPEVSADSSSSSTSSTATSPTQERQTQPEPRYQGQRQYSKPDFAFPQSQSPPSFASSSTRSRGNKRRRLNSQLASRFIARGW